MKISCWMMEKSSPGNRVRKKNTDVEKKKKNKKNL